VKSHGFAEPFGVHAVPTVEFAFVIEQVHMPPSPGQVASAMEPSEHVPVQSQPPFELPPHTPVTEQVSPPLLVPPVVTPAVKPTDPPFELVAPVPFWKAPVPPVPAPPPRPPVGVVVPTDPPAPAPVCDGSTTTFPPQPATKTIKLQVLFMARMLADLRQSRQKNEARTPR
jgi:hypothetical protein